MGGQPAKERAARPRKEEPNPGRAGNHLSVTRIVFLLPLTAFLIALGLQAGLRSLGFESTHPVRLLLTPAVGGVVVFFGLGRLPRRSRVRASLMAAFALLVFAFFT